jgi:hypothetical protein
MAIFGVSNQLLQIDTGLTRTYLYNPTTAFAPWKGLGENQVLGQRYFGVTSTTTGATSLQANPSGSPAIFMLVQYLSTSAITTGNLTTAAAPAPVYWTDETYTTVTGITTEALGGTTLGLNFPAGFMMLNTTSLTSLTAAQLVGSYIMIQVAGFLSQAYCSGSSAAGIGSWLVPVAGTLSMNSIAAGSSATYQPFGRQASVLSALTAGLVDVLVGCDII